MQPFTTMDIAAFGWFLAAWIGYGIVVEKSRFGDRSLTAAMNGHRRAWMRAMLGRDNRIVDTSIMASLQQGTAFFASTSLLALGGSLALMRASDEMLDIVRALPVAVPVTRAAWELKVFGLAIIFVYAFFKFAWAYRLFNYAAILMGAVPPKGTEPEAEAAAERAASMQTAAASHFNRGLRAFFFALAYLGAFLTPAALFVTTTAVLIVLYRRQFDSSALGAATGEPPTRTGV